MTDLAKLEGAFKALGIEFEYGEDKHIVALMVISGERCTEYVFDRETEEFIYTSIVRCVWND